MCNEVSNEVVETERSVEVQDKNDVEAGNREEEVEDAVKEVQDAVKEVQDAVKEVDYAMEEVEEVLEVRKKPDVKEEKQKEELVQTMQQGIFKD